MLHCTVDAPVLLQALKKINIRYHMYPFVQLQVQDGRLMLRTCTQPISLWSSVQERPSAAAKISISDSLATLQEGQHCAHYQALIRALTMFEGQVTVRQEEQAIMIEQLKGEIQLQTPVEGTSDFPGGRTRASHFPEETVAPEVGATYTTNETTHEECPACGTRKRKEWKDSYQISAVTTQHACVSQELLRSMVKQVAWAVADEETGRGSRGIYLSIEDGTLLLQARDGKSLAQRWEPLPGAERWEHEVILPAKQVQHLLRLFPKEADIHLEAVFLHHQHILRDEEPVTDAAPCVRARELRFASDGLEISLRLLSGAFPNAQSFFAQAREIQVTCATADLLRACEAVASIARNYSTPLWLHVSEAGITIEAGHEQFPQPARHPVAALAKTGGAISVATGSWYLPQMLKASCSPHITIELSRPSDPLVLRPAEGPDTFRYVVTAAKVF